ncbi:MerR family transcriptional regulator [Pseudoalteromonas xiamenensis]|uniref:MerR family transcriptional regulator n=1 Tax=Pseudoalteromonas xiamenensis TaxID=882626 RepID=A0A975DKY0_9GAMM|nr:MerR family transcriptional regulator [Pseudoalteromonas xiamenensis]QTH73544.1 MerR family transcriptional regulator [Pseudoalteromonas xiamenensis]
MYRISELAELVGLSRTALLYYEKLELIVAKRRANGYRVYNDEDVQTVRLIQQLQNGGLTLAECKACLKSKLDKEVLNTRYTALKNDIEQKQRSLDLLAGLLGKSDSKSWHTTLAQIAPDAHLNWLKVQGYDEKQALRIRWLSKDMNEHEKYMHDFFSLFETVENWGPGSEDDTRKAFNSLGLKPQRILEIGCGNGNSTLRLAKFSDAHIVAIDNEQSALDRLSAKIALLSLDARISTHCMSMTDLEFADGRFDLIWAEASIYVMGVQNALQQWKRVLNENGCIVFSDLVWLSEQRSDAAQMFWNGEYPDMQNVATRISLIEKAGYQIIESFTLSENAWKQYYVPLEAKLHALKSELNDSQAARDIQKEIDLYKNYLGEFGYQFFIIQKQ